MTSSPLHTDPDCLFCKIAAGKIPSKMVYQDDELLRFMTFIRPHRCIS
jgi:diadenosine tetraphosphate (Ap4A) HIT family hydrolase